MYVMVDPLTRSVHECCKMHIKSYYLESVN